MCKEYDLWQFLTTYIVRCTLYPSKITHSFRTARLNKIELMFTPKLDCVDTMPAHFENGENVMDRAPVHTKTAHFLPVDFENGRF